MMNKEDVLRKRREYNKRTGYASYHRYEKTPMGFLMRMYHNMHERVVGIQKKKFHLYANLYLLPKDEFYTWARNSPSFWEMFKVWEKSKYSRKLTPTVDRINPVKGYELSNMEWVTHSENSRRSSITRLRFKKI